VFTSQKCEEEVRDDSTRGKSKTRGFNFLEIREALFFVVHRYE
jgi:hypothetical protein